MKEEEYSEFRLGVFLEDLVSDLQWLQRLGLIEQSWIDNPPPLSLSYVKQRASFLLSCRLASCQISDPVIRQSHFVFCHLWKTSSIFTLTSPLQGLTPCRGPGPLDTRLDDDLSKANGIFFFSLTCCQIFISCKSAFNSTLKFSIQESENFMVKCCRPQASIRMTVHIKKGFYLMFLLQKHHSSLLFPDLLCCFSSKPNRITFCLTFLFLIHLKNKSCHKRAGFSET